jgi:nucleotide-binding universal stress UspA family protein
MTVVVGVDGLHNSHAAIRLAREEADFRKVPLVAVMAYSAEGVMGAPAGRPLATPRGPDEQRKIVESTLRQAVAEALDGQDTDVELRAVPGSPGHVLVETARSLPARMMVLATRHGGATSRLLGAVSQYVLRNAPCPVVVVPEGSKIQ